MAEQRSVDGGEPRGVMQDRAKRAVARAVRGGLLKQESCELCGKPETEAHHDRYERPLDVRWLCRSHHTLVHNALNARRDKDQPVATPATISPRRLKLTLEQIDRPVLVKRLARGEYETLGLWIPADWEA